MRQFSPSDDLLHDIAGRPNGRESLFWTFPLPEHGLAGIAYAWRDADTNQYSRLVGITDQLSAKPLYFDVAAGLDLEGDNLDDCVIGGLHILQPEPLTTCELFYEQDGITLSAAMTALHAPFSWHDGHGGCFSWAADDRYEQSMRTEGSVTIGGRTTSFTGVGHRDHSWGTRDWRALQHWKWINVISLDGKISTHAWMSFAYGDRQINGYVNRDGQVSPIVNLDVTGVLRDDLMHTSVSGVLTTADGKELRMESTSVAGLPINIHTLVLNEVAGKATLNGAPAASHIEYGWLSAYVQQLTDAG